MKALHWLFPPSISASWFLLPTSAQLLGQRATPSSPVVPGLCCLWAAAPGFGLPGPPTLPAYDGNRGQHPSKRGQVICSQAGGSGGYDLFPCQPSQQGPQPQNDPVWPGPVDPQDRLCLYFLCPPLSLEILPKLLLHPQLCLSPPPKNPILRTFTTQAS